MKILNLYCGIGGNRKQWGDEHEITAIEFNPDIAEIYKENFPKDNVIVCDAHEYLLKHFQEFDFIWASPPCQSHTRLNTASFPSGSKDYVFPDLKLYEEIIFLKKWFKGIFVIENVIPYYPPLIQGEEVDRHLFWANFKIGNYIVKNKKATHEKAQVPYLEKYLGYNLDNYKGNNKRQILRNCVLPETGKYILDRALGIVNQKSESQTSLF